MTWGFGQITNHTQQILLVDYSIAPGQTLSGSQLNTSMGNALLDVGAFGVVQFSDVGDGSPHGTVRIDFSEQTQYWHYDNHGSLDVTISADGMLTLTGQGQTITGALT